MVRTCGECERNPDQPQRKIEGDRSRGMPARQVPDDVTEWTAKREMWTEPVDNIM